MIGIHRISQQDASRYGEKTIKGGPAPQFPVTHRVFPDRP
jgi:hypothetical protein